MMILQYKELVYEVLDIQPAKNGEGAPIEGTWLADCRDQHQPESSFQLIVSDDMLKLTKYQLFQQPDAIAAAQHETGSQDQSQNPTSP